jgi:hypothetical protein
MSLCVFESRREAKRMEGKEGLKSRGKGGREGGRERERETEGRGGE